MTSGVAALGSCSCSWQCLPAQEAGHTGDSGIQTAAEDLTPPMLTMPCTGHEPTGQLFTLPLCSPCCSLGCGFCRECRPIATWGRLWRGHNLPQPHLCECTWKRTVVRGLENSHPQSTLLQQEEDGVHRWQREPKGIESSGSSATLSCRNAL